MYKKYIKNNEKQNIHTLNKNRKGFDPKPSTATNYQGIEQNHDHSWIRDSKYTIQFSFPSKTTEKK